MEGLNSATEKAEPVSPCDPVRVPRKAAARGVVVNGAPDPVDERTRRSIVVDSRMQWRAALAVGGVIAATLVLMSITRAALGADDADDSGGDKAAHLALIWNGVFVGFVLAAVVTFVLLWTHRVAGPARVLRRAVDGLCANDFEQRASVRRGDYLRDLSASVLRLGRKMRSDRELLRIAFDGIARALAEGDPAAAERLVEKYRRERGLV